MMATEITSCAAKLSGVSDRNGLRFFRVDQLINKLYKDIAENENESVRTYLRLLLQQLETTYG